MTTRHVHAQARIARRALCALLAVIMVACAPSDSAPPGGGDGDGETSVRIEVTGPGRIVQGAFTCRGDCAWEGDDGASASFEAVPDPGFVFVSWGDGCPAALDDTCTRTLEAGDAITATFARHALRLDLTGDGEGTFHIAGGGIDTRCDDDCGIGLGASLQLAITYENQGTTGTTLENWAGACTDSDRLDYCLVNVSSTTDVGKTWRHPPVASADDYVMQGDTNLDVDATDGVLANDEDSPGDPLTAALESDVAHGTLSLRADGGFSYEPDAFYFGEDRFEYRVRDAFGNDDTAEAILDVTPGDVNRAPDARDDAYATTRNAQLSVDATGGVLANDTDADGDPLAATLAEDVEDGTLSLRTDGSFDYDPGGYVGVATFAYRASDGDATSDLATVTITSTNQAPVAVPDSYATRRNRPLSIGVDEGVLANDVDPDGDSLTATLIADVEHGTLDFRADGRFSYRPDRGFDGDDTFTYRASDGIDASTTTTVAIRVTNDDDSDDGDDDDDDDEDD